MSISDDRSLSRKRLQDLGAQLANDRKLDILSFAADHEQFTVIDLKDALDLPHSTAHEYCRDLQQAGLLGRVQEKPATYRAVDFEVHLSIDDIAAAVETEDQTLEYAVERYGNEIIDEMLDVWERVEAGEYTYREASADLGIDHADFLRIAGELELFDR